jgi:hypothetical protein
MAEPKEALLSPNDVVGELHQKENLPFIYAGRGQAPYGPK